MLFGTVNQRTTFGGGRIADRDPYLDRSDLRFEELFVKEIICVIE
jgi:hypothetical protein